MESSWRRAGWTRGRRETLHRTRTHSGIQDAATKVYIGRIRLVEVLYSQKSFLPKKLNLRLQNKSVYYCMCIFPHQMDKASNKDMTPSGARIKKWNKKRAAYTCLDGTMARIPNRAFRRE